MPDPNAPSNDVGDDLRADLEGAWSESESPESATSSADTSAPASSGAAQPSDPPAEGAPVDAGRARGPDGKFVKAEPAAPNAQAQAPEFKVPEKWPEHVKRQLAEIHAANPAHAAFVLEQYNTMRSIAAQQHQKANAYLQSYEQYLAPTRQERALKGIDDGMHIRHLLAADDFIRKSPREAIQWLAHAHGIDLQQIANPQAGGEPEIPPYVRELQQQVQQFKQLFHQQAVGMEQQQLQAASSWIDSFANQTDASGNKLYPYFDDVLNEIIFGVQYQMQTGQPVDVKAAYDRAIRLNDQVWLKAERARSESAKTANEAQRRRNIEDAKRAAVSVSGSSATSSLEPPSSIREGLERAWDEHS